MSSVFSSDFKELVRSRTDLVELVGEYLTLHRQRGGREYAGLCPFHDDHNPSLKVNSDRQSYKCWVCSEGGDCFSFAMKIEGLQFREALEFLARRAHIEIPKQFRAPSEAQRNDKNRLYDILAWAEAEMHRCLLQAPEAAPAREYLKGRGFTPETVAKFQLGFHPAGWEWLQERARGKFTAADLFAARLARERRDQSGYYDEFRNRVMFPIRDQGGRPVAFGGRVLPGSDDENGPKYLNSPESEVFAKSRLLFGLDIARHAIRKSETVVVMEGYTDCITAHQYGFESAVATLGTALTETHVTALKRFARTVVLVYDGDKAGQDAAERTLAKFLSQKVDLRVLTLPGGQDPADYLLAHGGEAFRDQVAAAKEALEHKLQTTIDRHGLRTIDARQRVLDEVLELIAQAPGLASNVREDMIVSRLAQKVLIEEQVIRQRLRGARSAKPQKPVAAVKTTVHPAEGAVAEPTSKRHELVERELLQIILLAPRLTTMIQPDVAAEDLVIPELQRIYRVCCELSAKGIEPSYEKLMETIEDPRLKQEVVTLDEDARTLHVDATLANSASDATGRPLFLLQTIDNLKWRNRQASYEESKGRMAEQDDASSRLKPEDMEDLRRWTEFHARRATKQSIGH